MSATIEPTTPEATVAVRCEGVIKTFGEGNVAVQALRGVNLEVRKGELLMLDILPWREHLLRLPGF
jgi:hypothetical protein